MYNQWLNISTSLIDKGVVLIQKIDDSLEVFWGWILNPICRLTGKGNFFFARAFVVLGWILFMNPGGRPSLLWAVSFIPVSLLWWLFFGVTSLITYWILEQHQSTETISPALPAIKLARRRDLMWGIAIFTLTFDWSIPLSFVSLSASGYFATNSQPPRKSLAKEALEKLADALQRVPSLAPSPA